MRLLAFHSVFASSLLDAFDVIRCEVPVWTLLWLKIRRKSYFVFEFVRISSEILEVMGVNATSSLMTKDKRGKLTSQF